MAIEPFDDAAFERPGLGLFPGLPAIELGDAGALIEKRLPILSGPRVVIRGDQGDDIRLVTPYGLQHGGRGLSLRIEDQVGARDAEADSVFLRHAKGLDSAHIRFLQPPEYSDAIARRGAQFAQIGFLEELEELRRLAVQ